jgi:hypothetical protein
MAYVRFSTADSGWKYLLLWNAAFARFARAIGSRETLR